MSLYREVRQSPCSYCLARPGDPCRTRTGHVLEAGGEHEVRVQAWRARWLAEYQPPPRQPAATVTVAMVTAGMRKRPGFSEEAGEGP